MTDWVLLDQTGGAATADGDSLTPNKLAFLAALAELQLNRDYKTHCGGLGGLVRAGSSPTDVRAGENRFVLYPTLEQAPGAEAYHDDTALGDPEAFDAITLSDSIFGPDNSLLIAVTHEILEAEGNPGCNLWADDGQGHEYPRERCDAVQSQSYPITVDVNGQSVTAHVTNFLLDAFFTPNHPGPYDFMSLTAVNDNGPGAPFQTAPGGDYQYERDTAADTQRQVTAKRSLMMKAGGANSESRRAERRAPMRAHPKSRAARLGFKSVT